MMRVLLPLFVASLAFGGCSDRNPLVDMAPSDFYSIVEPHMRGQLANECRKMWKSGDPGPVECGPLASKLAGLLGSDADDLREPVLWDRYASQQLKAMSQRIYSESERPAVPRPPN